MLVMEAIGQEDWRRRIAKGWWSTSAAYWPGRGVYDKDIASISGDIISLHSRQC